MSNIDLIIEERAAKIGKFMVGRLLPFRQKRMVGPFIYIDHMGPVALTADDNFDVLPHPHIGLSTLTYLFEGSIMHRDSLGNAVEIKPGSVNWMTSGRGIVHSERTPDYMRHAEKRMHGLQIWVALPKEKEQMLPEFHQIPETGLPNWNEAGVAYTLIAGEALGRQSAVPVHSRLFLLEIKNESAATVMVKPELYGETGLYILHGTIESEGHGFHEKQLLVTSQGNLCGFELGANTTVYLFGGDPFPEERLIDWNFVASDKALIDAARAAWRAQTFDKIPGDAEAFIPYPHNRD
jgi:redox-sensitive bicupin YhaK (pirin superfamily)